MTGPPGPAGGTPLLRGDDRGDFQDGSDCREDRLGLFQVGRLNRPGHWPAPCRTVPVASARLKFKLVAGPWASGSALAGREPASADGTFAGCGA